MKTHYSNSRAMSLMQLLIGIAIFIVLISVAYPVWVGIQRKKHGAVALGKMKQLGSAFTQYVSLHDNTLPEEESTSGHNDWHDTEQPEAEKAWYNCIPRQAGVKGVGDYAKANDVAGFYSDSNLLYLPGADYPNKQKSSHPYFAYAYNTKLQRKVAGPNGKQSTERKQSVVMSRIQNPNRTVAFLEQGLRGEKRPLDFMKKYDGEDCKASAKQFVVRSGTKGLVVFVSGSAELVDPKEIMEAGEPGGRIKWNADDQSGIFWTADTKEDPN